MSNNIFLERKLGLALARGFLLASINPSASVPFLMPVIFPSPSAHLQSFQPDFSQDLTGARADGSFGPVHPDTDRSGAESRERQPLLIIVGDREAEIYHCSPSVSCDFV
jgi:hypothetical protein